MYSPPNLVLIFCFNFFLGRAWIRRALSLPFYSSTYVLKGFQRARRYSWRNSTCALPPFLPTRSQGRGGVCEDRVEGKLDFPQNSALTAPPSPLPNLSRWPFKVHAWAGGKQSSMVARGCGWLGSLKFATTSNIRLGPLPNQSEGPGEVHKPQRPTTLPSQLGFTQRSLSLPEGRSLSFRTPQRDWARTVASSPFITFVLTFMGPVSIVVIGRSF